MLGQTNGCDEFVTGLSFLRVLKALNVKTVTSFSHKIKWKLLPRLDTVGTVYHLVIYIQSNKIHKVF